MQSTMRRWPTLRARTRWALLAAVLLAAGCSTSEAGGGSSSVPSSGAEASTTVSSTAASAVAPAAESAGCGEVPDPGPGTEAAVDVEQTIDSGQATRTYRLGVPIGYDPDVATPLLFNFHGIGSNAIQQSVYSGLPKAAQGRGLLVVTPDGLDGRWKFPLRPDAGSEDIEFVKDLLVDISARYCIDPNRVHAAGMSLGGGMSASVACAIPDTFAAIGMVTLEVQPAGCEPVPALAFHGTDDPVVPYGSVDSAASGGTLQNLEDWATLDGCETEPQLDPIGNDVQHRVYPGCDGGAEVELYTVLGGGHTWPGSDIKIGSPTETIDATELILDFFDEHPLAP